MVFILFNELYYHFSGPEGAVISIIHSASDYRVFSLLHDAQF